MQKRIMYLFAGIAALIAATVSARTAPVSDDCLAAPGREAPQSRHWYYRVDRANHRKCWYLDRKRETAHRAAAPRAAAPARGRADVAPDAAGDPMRSEVGEREKPVAGRRADQPPDAASSAPEAVGPGGLSVTWAEPSGADVAATAATLDQASEPPDGGGERAPTASADPMPDSLPPGQAVQSASPTAESPVPPDPKPVLALIAGALALAAILGRFTFRHVGLRRPAKALRAAERDPVWISPARAAPISPAPRTGNENAPCGAEEIPLVPREIGGMRRPARNAADVEDHIVELLRMVDEGEQRTAA